MQERTKAADFAKKGSQATYKLESEKYVKQSLLECQENERSLLKAIEQYKENERNMKDQLIERQEHESELKSNLEETINFNKKLHTKNQQLISLQKLGEQTEKNLEQQIKTLRENRDELLEVIVEQKEKLAEQ